MCVHLRTEHDIGNDFIYIYIYVVVIDIVTWYEIILRLKQTEKSYSLHNS